MQCCAFVHRSQSSASGFSRPACDRRFCKARHPGRRLRVCAGSPGQAGRGQAPEKLQVPPHPALSRRPSDRHFRGSSDRGARLRADPSDRGQYLHVPGQPQSLCPLPAAHAAPPQPDGQQLGVRPLHPDHQRRRAAEPAHVGPAREHHRTDGQLLQYRPQLFRGLYRGHPLLLSAGRQGFPRLRVQALHARRDPAGPL